MVEVPSRRLVDYTGIHSSVPENVNPQGGLSFDFDERRERILRYLTEPGRRGQWRTAFKIADACGLDKGGTQELVRKLIKEINYFARARGVGFCIVSSHRGFMYVEDPNAIKVAIQRERMRAAGLRKSIGVLYGQFVDLGGDPDELNKYEEEI